MGLSARLSRLAALALTAVACATTQGQTTEQLSAQIPDGWVKARENTLASLTLSEWVPGDTGQEWQQKLTLEAMQADDLPDPIDFVQGLSEQQKDACSRFADSPVFTGFENGYPTAVHILECHENKRTQKPLLTMVKAIQGNKAFYTITRIWRLEPPASRIVGDDGTLPIDESEVAAWAQELRKFTLCDAALAAHPCAD